VCKQTAARLAGAACLW